LETLLQKKSNMAPMFWNAQYMQNPTGEAGALIKREWWSWWEKEDPPECEYVIMSLDAAQEAHNRADYTAWQVWGIWYDDKERANIILLDAWQRRMEYPELKQTMLTEYERWTPDTFLIEKKSSGSALYQEFRSAGLPVSEFTPGKGNDKIARVNSVSEIFSSGLVWAPAGRRWALEVIEQCSDFPNGDYDDAVDAMTLAIRRFRTGGFIRLDTDAKDEETSYQHKRRYY
jgi:predicted phage terminase large subunit-like protein